MRDPPVGRTRVRGEDCPESGRGSADGCAHVSPVARCSSSPPPARASVSSRPAAARPHRHPRRRRAPPRVRRGNEARRGTDGCGAAPTAATTGSAPAAAGAPAQQGGRTDLRVTLPAEPAVLNPVLVSGDRNFSKVSWQLYDALTVYDYQTGKLQPQLATEWQQKSPTIVGIQAARGCPVPQRIRRAHRRRCRVHGEQGRQREQAAQIPLFLCAGREGDREIHRRIHAQPALPALPGHHGAGSRRA